MSALWMGQVARLGWGGVPLPARLPGAPTPGCLPLLSPQTIQSPDLRNRSRTYCQWMRMLTRECVQHLPTYIDAMAYLERLEPRPDLEPNLDNTAWHAEWVAAGGKAAESLDWVPKPVVEVAGADAALEAVRQLAAADSPVLFLGALPRFDGDAALPEADAGVQSCWLFRPDFDPASQLPQDAEQLARMRAFHGLAPLPKQ